MLLSAGLSGRSDPLERNFVPSREGCWGATAKLPRSSGPFVEDFAQNGRKCPQGIMRQIDLC